MSLIQGYGATVLLFLAGFAVPLIRLRGKNVPASVSYGLAALGSAAGIGVAWGAIHSPPVSQVIMTLSNLPGAFPITIRLDGISGYFMLLLFALTLAISVYAPAYGKHYGEGQSASVANGLFSGFVLSMLLVFTAGNQFTFLLGWELMALLSYFLVVTDHTDKDTRWAGTLYAVMTHIGAAFLLAAILILYTHTGSFEFVTAGTPLAPAVKNTVFVLLLLAFGTKAGMVPLHIWLPKAHPAAPAHVSALMSGVMIKTAIYGLIRFVFMGLGITAPWWGPVLLGFGMVTAVVGVLCAYIERDIKKLLAFSSIENIGIILMGLGLAAEAAFNGNTLLEQVALGGTLFHVFSHGLFKGLLFLEAGSVQYATHTRNLEQLGGLGRRMPVSLLLMLTGALAASAIPPFNGFAGEFMLYLSFLIGLGTAGSGSGSLMILAVAALAICGALAAGAMVKLVGIGFLGRPRSRHSEDAAEVPLSMRIGAGLLAAGCLLTGLMPLRLLQVIQKAFRDTGIFTDAPGDAFWFRGGTVPFRFPMVQQDMLLIAALLVVLMGLAGLFAAALIRRNGHRIYGTWDCGFERLTGRMQYSAVGFSKPVHIVFRPLFSPQREMTVEPGLTEYHPEEIRYDVHSEPVFEQYFYRPVSRRSARISHWFKKRIQTGSVQRYLLYIFVTVLALILYRALA